MLRTIQAWVRRHYRQITGSIAFLPAFIALLFALLAAVMFWFDHSDLGMHLKESLHWLRLKDASAARAITTTIAAGIITLTVFSFSMVMIVLNQAASQLTNRVLEQLIENRFQQLVLVPTSAPSSTRCFC